MPTSGGRVIEPPRWRCHKEVHALRITDTAPRADGGALLFVEGFQPIAVEHDVVRRYMPIAGDYLVIYQDSYRSISPRAVFEDGYTPI